MLKTTEPMEKSTKNVLEIDGRVNVDRLDRFVVTKNELRLSLIDFPENFIVVPGRTLGCVSVNSVRNE